VSNKSGIPVVETFLENIYTQKTIIFIGISFNDKFIYRFLEYLATKHKSKSHFLLTSENSVFYLDYRKKADEYRKANEIKRANDQENKYYQDLMKINIYPIVYRQNIFVERLLEKLSKERRVTSMISYPITGEPV